MYFIFVHQIKVIQLRGRGSITVSPQPVDHVPTFTLVFEYQTIASEIFTQPSHYKKAENNLLADKKGPQHWIQLVIRINIHLYLYIYLHQYGGNHKQN